MIDFLIGVIISSFTHFLILSNVSLECSLIGSTIPSLIAPNNPVLSLVPSEFNFPNKSLLIPSVFESNPAIPPTANAGTNPTLEDKVKLPINEPAIADGTNFFNLSPNSLLLFSQSSSPNNVFFISSLFLANATAEPNKIPPTGPIGVNKPVTSPLIPPTVPNLSISGRYLFTLSCTDLGITPPWRSPSLRSPNNQFFTSSDLWTIPKAAPAAAPNNGPPTIPVIKLTPPPINPVPIAYGAYSLILPITSAVALPNLSSSSLDIPKALAVAFTASDNVVYVLYANGSSPSSNSLFFTFSLILLKDVNKLWSLDVKDSILPSFHIYLVLLSSPTFL